MNLPRFILSSLFALWLAGMASLEISAQPRFPLPSPASTLKQVVGITDIEIEYARPGVKNRVIFGKHEPYGVVWRTGANASTNISFSNDVRLGGHLVPAGKYALYTIPEKNDWTIIIYKNSELWGAFSYDPKDDLVRFKAKTIKLDQLVETFTISIGDLRDETANIYLDWEYTRVVIPLEVDTKSHVYSQLKTEMGKPESQTVGTLNAAAVFYYENGHDLEVAHDWITKANSLREKPAYWMYYTQAQIESELGMINEGLSSAHRALILAKEARHPVFIEKCRDLIEKLDSAK